jgi:ADP-heptose:LPS heptosyltransferase
VGFAPEVRGMFGMRWINEAVPLGPSTAAVPRALAMADYLGVSIYPVEFRYPIMPEARQWAEELAPRTGLPLIALVLGTSTAIKSWPVEHFVRLIEILRGEGADVVLIGAAGEAEREAAVQAALAVPALSAVGKTSLPQLAALLARCDAVVAGDTGALHVAAAVGTPVVGLYGPTSPALSGPYGEQHRVLWDQPACGPCRRRPRCKDYHCMSDLTPERVAEAVREIVASREPRVASGDGTEPEHRRDAGATPMQLPS